MKGYVVYARPFDGDRTSLGSGMTDAYGFALAGQAIAEPGVTPIIAVDKKGNRVVLDQAQAQFAQAIEGMAIEAAQ